MYKFVVAFADNLKYIYMHIFIVIGEWRCALNEKSVLKRL